MKKSFLRRILATILICSLLMISGIFPLSAAENERLSLSSTDNLSSDLNYLKLLYSNCLDPETLDEVINSYLSDNEFQSWYYQDKNAAISFVNEGLQNLSDILQEQRNNSETAVPYGGLFPNYTTAVYPVCQARTYWCGPAAAVQALIGAGIYTYGLSNYDAAQEIIANDSNTTTEGAYVGPLKDAMNHRINAALGNNSLLYTYTTISSSIDQYTLVNKIIGNSIQKDRPCVVSVLLKNLPYYTGSSNGGHYITIRAINGSTGTAVIVDPHYNSAYRGEHTVTYSQLRTMLNGRTLIYAP